MEIKEIKVRFTLIEEALGMMPADKNIHEHIHEQYVAGKAPDAPSLEEEVAAVGVEEVVDKATNNFSETGRWNAVFLGLSD